MITNLRISGMHCNHCVRSIDRALRAVPGVSAVEVDLAGGAANVTHAEQTALPSLEAAVESAGYAIAKPA